jgi:hypothetical protein
MNFAILNGVAAIGQACVMRECFVDVVSFHTHDKQYGLEPSHHFLVPDAHRSSF